MKIAAGLRRQSRNSGPRGWIAKSGPQRRISFPGKFDIEFAQLGGLGNELLVRRPGVVALDLEGAFQAFGAGQLFPRLRRGFDGFFGVIDDLGGDGLGAFAPNAERVQGHVHGGLAGFLAVFVSHAQPFRALIGQGFRAVALKTPLPASTIVIVQRTKCNGVKALHRGGHGAT